MNLYYVFYFQFILNTRNIKEKTFPAHHRFVSCGASRVPLCSVVPSSLRSCGLQPARPLCLWSVLIRGIFTTQGSHLHLLYLLHLQAGSLLLAPPRRASLVAQMVKNLPSMLETQFGSLGWEDALEKGMATHSCILAWRTPWTKKPGSLVYRDTESDTTE